MDLHFEHKFVYYWHPHVYELVDRVVMVSPGDSVLSATKKMVEVHASSAVVAVGSKPQGILTSVDLIYT
jgi:CBS domain-containing protein